MFGLSLPVAAMAALLVGQTARRCTDSANILFAKQRPGIATRIEFLGELEESIHPIGPRAVQMKLVGGEMTVEAAVLGHDHRRRRSVLVPRTVSGEV
jgi:hypothetical protein